MQENVKVFTPEVLVEIFGNVKVKGDFTYKLRVDRVNSRQLSELAKVNEDYGMNFHVGRSGKGLIIYSPSIPCGKDKDAGDMGGPQISKTGTIRYFYEMKLPQEARIAAFENTAQAKLENPARDLRDAILQSFYISDTPQGAVYWQDVILYNE